MFKIRQDAPTLTQVDVGQSGASHGDMLAFEAGLTLEDGSKGLMSGILITVDLPDGADLFEDRVGQIVFNVGSGNEIVVAGISNYAKDAAEMNAGQPQVRAVIGGTGQYIGARGQVTTRRNPDGSYEHAFELIDD
ncbi:hypothetical protein C3941_08755 [Kaistia algarum]|uniref:hypothetical protein n=1 Tax=Kaistia algarum TaxID=2083279 RepID=UPI000CE76E9A|nr:hypothetical protein [Kaistia algarum]MCX5512147.1 hypothetical protein [Kaistia algarum]PPE80251.1 hypothetical protein C3941_08755 [Kaistia algarum]